jgi:outer membrane receptor protein involved in Fe transport
LYRPFTVFPVVTQANARLRNERLEGYEAGIDYASSNAIDLSLTAFDNRVKHAIANVTIGPNLRQRQNIDAIHARGIEAGVNAKLGEFSFSGSLAWTNAEARGSGAAAALDGNRPAQTPRWSASGTASWRPRAHTFVALTARHVGAQFEDDLETDVLPAATTLDLFAQFPIARNFALVLRGENLTGETVVTRNQSGSMDYGAPQTIWAGIKLGL